MTSSTAASGPKKQEAGQTWNFKTKVLQRPNDDVTTTSISTSQNDDLAVEVGMLLLRVLEVNDVGYRRWRPGFESRPGLPHF